MNKKFKNTLIVGAFTLSVFAVGSIVGASQADLFGQISSDAAQKIGDAGKNKNEELLTDVQGKIQQKVKDNINPKVDAKKSEMEKELQSYFDQKLNTVTNTTEYQAAVTDLDRIKTNLLTDYKKQIDSAFGTK